MRKSHQQKQQQKQQQKKQQQYQYQHKYEEDDSNSLPQILTPNTILPSLSTLDAGDVVECYALVRKAKLEDDGTGRLFDMDGIVDNFGNGNGSNSGNRNASGDNNNNNNDGNMNYQYLEVRKTALAFRYKPKSSSPDAVIKTPFELTLEYGPQRTGSTQSFEAMPSVNGHLRDLDPKSAGTVNNEDGRYVTWGNGAKIYYTLSISNEEWSNAYFMAPITGAVLSKILNDYVIQYPSHYPRYQPFTILEKETDKTIVKSSNSDDFVWNVFQALADMYVDVQPILVPEKYGIQLYVENRKRDVQRLESQKRISADDVNDSGNGNSNSNGNGNNDSNNNNNNNSDNDGDNEDRMNGNYMNVANAAAQFYDKLYSCIGAIKSGDYSAYDKTAMPSVSPTASPTTSPTMNPTMNPTSAPKTSEPTSQITSTTSSKRTNDDETDSTPTRTNDDETDSSSSSSSSGNNKNHKKKHNKNNNSSSSGSGSGNNNGNNNGNGKREMKFSNADDYIYTDDDNNKSGNVSSNNDGDNNNDNGYDTNSNENGDDDDNQNDVTYMKENKQNELSKVLNDEIEDNVENAENAAEEAFKAAEAAKEAATSHSDNKAAEAAEQAAEAALQAAHATSEAAALGAIENIFSGDGNLMTSVITTCFSDPKYKIRYDELSTIDDSNNNNNNDNGDNDNNGNNDDGILATTTVSTTHAYIYIDGSHYYRLNLTEPYMTVSPILNPLPRPSIVPEGKGDFVDITLAFAIIGIFCFGMLVMLHHIRLLNWDNRLKFEWFFHPTKFKGNHKRLDIMSEDNETYTADDDREGDGLGDGFDDDPYNELSMDMDMDMDRNDTSVQKSIELTSTSL